MDSRGRFINIVTLVLALASLVGIILVFMALPAKPDKSLEKDARTLAGELVDNNLPEAAIEEYQKILRTASLDKAGRGAIYYLIGKTYFDEMGDYENAAANYIRARSLDDKAPYNTEAGKNLITCLERMGRHLDARRELDRQASLNPDSTASAGKLVAKVGSYDITQTDFNDALDRLPPQMRTQYSTPEGKRAFLDQLIGRELIYHAALRDGMDTDSRVKKDLHLLERDYLVQHYSQTKILPTIKPDTADLQLYYQAHKDEFGDKDFESVRDTVTQAYMMYIGQKTVNDYISTLQKAEPVTVFEENLK